MAKKYIRKKTSNASLFSGKHLFFYIRYAISILSLFLSMEYSAKASPHSGKLLKDSSVALSSLVKPKSDISNVKLTSPDLVDYSVNPPFFSVSAAILNATCTPTNSGSIDITVNDGIAPYTFLWSNGSITEDISELVSGTYTVTVTDNVGNIIEKGFQVRKSCLEVTKEVSSGPINNGDSTYTLSYTIKIYNAGDIDLTQVVLIDNLTYTFQEGSFFDKLEVISQEFVINEFFDGIEDYTINTETYDVLAPDGVGYITFSVRVTPRNKDEVYTNIASFYAYDSGGMFISGESSTATVTFSDRPEIELTKVAQQTSYDQPGDLINYAVTVINSGNVTLTNVTVTDPLTGMNEVIPVLGVGASSIMSTVYTVTQLDIDAGLVTNTVTATGTFSSTILTAFDSAEVPADQHPLISVVKTAVDNSYNQIGNLVDFDIIITNMGNVTLTDVLVEDPLTNFSNTISTLAVNQTITLTTTYTVTQADLDAGLIINTVTATSDFGLFKVSDSDDDTIYGQQFPGLAILKTARPLVYNRLGEVITYDISVTNTGNVTLSNILVTDPLTGLSQTVSSLGASNTYTITTTHAVTQPNLDLGLVINTATATSTFSVTLLADSDDETVYGLKLPALSIVKKAQKSKFNKKDEIVYYNIIVSNIGNVSLYNVIVGDPLTNLSAVIPFIPVGGFQLLTTSYRITQTDILAKVVNNTATASGIFYGQSRVVSDNELITSSQKPPVAIDDRNTTLMSVKVSGNVLPNDSDPDGDAISVSEFLILGKTYIAGSTAVIPGVGTIILNANGIYTFTPLPTFVGLVPNVGYSITDGNGNRARAILRIQVIPLPNPPELILKDTSICENEIVELTVSSKNVENPVYTWYSDSLLTNQVFSGSLFTTPKLTQTTNYYVRLNGSNLLPTLPLIVKKITVLVIPLPAKPEIRMTGKSILCPGDSTILSSSQALAYQWYKNEVLIAGANQQSITVKEAGAYSVRTSGINGCISVPSEIVSIAIALVPPPPTIAADKSAYCLGDTAKLTSSSSAVNYWYRNDVQLLADSGKSIKTTLPGKYTVINKNQSGCYSSISNTVIVSFNEVPAKPNVIIDGPVIFCEGDYRILKTTIPSGYTVQWFKDGILMDGKNKDTLRITAAGKYTAQFTNASGCVSPFSECICTEIKCETDIYTPDIFTPNEDDINDVIKPSIPGIRKFICFKVYNRWGNLIFYTTDPYKGWDGKYKGLNQPAESYMWIVEGFDSQGKKIKKSGMLSLMR